MFGFDFDWISDYLAWRWSLATSVTGIVIGICTIALVIAYTIWDQDR